MVELVDYRQILEHELVVRRFNEVESAKLQRQARSYVMQRNWQAVERTISQLEERAHDNPWLMQTVSYLRRLLEQHDHAMIEKELVYASRNLSSRSTEMDEMVFYSMAAESAKPAHVRRKVVKGHSSESQS